MQRSRLVLCLLLVAVVWGCGGDDDGMTGSDGGTGTDGSTDGCAGAADGTACGTGLICIGGECLTSGCGDGFVDTAGGEECDDGNSEAFDGCEPGTCTFTCSDDAACNDGAPCNGDETCADHVCMIGTPPADGTACTLDAGGDGVCRTGGCVPAGCGNGVVDAGEDCDDMNDVEGDGCDADCTFSCNEDIDCSDGDVCNGSEVCDMASHACSAGTPEDCSDGDACTMDTCDPIDGCQNPLIDADGDGHAPSSLGACGDDCDDTRADVYTGAEELCDGVDNNCNVDVDEVAPTWYIDCDRDSFAASTDGSRTGCTEPASSATGCSGRWTTTRPSSPSSTDCNDNNANVFPGQTAYFTTPIPGAPTATRFDYDCSGAHSRQYSCGPSGGGCGTDCSSGYAPRDASTNPNGCTFLCVSGRCFVTDYPDCGESANYNTCSRVSISSCLSLSRARTQGCH